MTATSVNYIVQNRVKSASSSSSEEREVSSSTFIPLWNEHFTFSATWFHLKIATFSSIQVSNIHVSPQDRTDASATPLKLVSGESDSPAAKEEKNITPKSDSPLSRSKNKEEKSKDTEKPKPQKTNLEVDKVRIASPRSPGSAELSSPSILFSRPGFWEIRFCTRHV